MYEKFRKLINERGITPYRVSMDTGIAQSCLSDWKNGRSNPKVDKLVTIARYLGVSIEDLIDTSIENK
ncbi:MAG: helix-turn-helix domain-containing protein [Velocimicrobium sp.]